MKTVKECKKGDFVKINGKGKVYIRGDYDRVLKKFHLIDTYDVYGNGRYVKGDKLVDNSFTY